MNIEHLRIGSLIATVVGGPGSICLMLMSGLHPPVLLVVLFIGWVLAPFAVLVLAGLLSRRWSGIARYTLHCVTLIIVVGSLAIYGYVFVRPPISQPAFPFVVVPIGSWLLIATVLPVAALISRMRAQQEARSNANDQNIL